jgi:hypothetical protein
MNATDRVEGEDRPLPKDVEDRYSGWQKGFQDAIKGYYYLGVVSVASS